MSANSTTHKNKLVSQWLEDYGNDMYSWAFYKTGSKETAEDLVQECFISAHKSFSSYKEGSNAKTWLFAILNNKIIDYYRSGNTKRMFTETQLRGSEVQNEFFNEAGVWNGAHDFYGEEERPLLDNPKFLEVFDSCIQNLPPNWRNVIVSKYINRKKGTTIRKEMEITASNMWQMAHRAKLQLKKCLDANWQVEE